MDCSPPGWATLVAQLVKNLTSVRFLSWEVPLEKGKMPGKGIGLPIPVLLAFPHGSDSKVSTCKAGDLGSIPGLGRSPGEGNGNPLQYACLENPMDEGGYSPWGHKESDMTERLNRERRLKKGTVSLLVELRAPKEGMLGLWGCVCECVLSRQ